MKIEKFQQKFLDETKKLSDTLFDNGWTTGQFEQELSKSNSVAFVLADKNSVVGFVFAVKIFDQLEILNLGIQKEFQGRGFAKLLLQNVLDFCEDNDISKVFLEVRQNNLPAVNLYKGFGFKTNRVRHKYYGNEDGFEMLLDLEKF